MLIIENKYTMFFIARQDENWENYLNAARNTSTGCSALRPVPSAI